ncbi:carboxypeptidase-like regulatory domain-containing protein [Clostridium chauvoei]|uniref:carboxypeptidase-like regulatory domain-containing protein n=1 Tax=Clostridium chauvoei TaxID=46867 RepID=UPI001C86615C|nr:carboxypeptidase-like regulatory domain-containing protein [Clostridium chauvoei]MBX7394963.1 carboxypeptidase-like regulatory domain-containing protein [Clostridium chauvoei]
MSGRIASCPLTTGVNEQIEAVVRLPEEKRSVIFGTVLDPNGNPVPDAVVKLLKVVDGCKYPYPLTHTFTDCYGQFLLGPLCPNTKYMLKIYKDNINIKFTTLQPNPYNGQCLGKNVCESNPEPENPPCGCGCGCGCGC